MYGTCQLKLFLHFILLASYLFSCLSASLLGYVQTSGMSLCACLCARSTETKTAWSVKSCGRNAQTPVRGGLCRRTQTEMKARNGCAAFSQLPAFVTVWVLALKGRNGVINCPDGFQLTLRSLLMAPPCCRQHLKKPKKQQITRDMERSTTRRNLLRPAAALKSIFNKGELLHISTIASNNHWMFVLLK